MTSKRLGLPCWEVENVEQAIRRIARTDKEGVDYFLASHAPINNIQHDETAEVFNEETLFHALFKSKAEILAIIHGAPGTGKSHLIHWLKLRTEDALQQGGLRKIVPILIERRTGSLKDALEQMVEQLGDDFEHYISPVQNALNKISADTAREKLINNIGIELGAQQRIDRNREMLPKALKELAEVCSGSKGFRKWLCRQNGIACSVIQHLTEQKLPGTEASISDKLPNFTAKELLPEAHYRRIQDNTQTVRDLIDEFEFDAELAEHAAGFFNEVLPDAIKEMTGLGGTNLRDIFDRIRSDLKKKGETLALFIEDVTVMSALNEEVFNAVEPQTRQGLCRMVAVLGSTPEAWNRLLTNQRQRVTHPISIGETETAWHKDAKTITEFAGRYLNTVRLTEEQIGAVVAYRRSSGSDINISACDSCPVREECHRTFGKTRVGNVDIGLFPFSNSAPFRLLGDLSTKAASRNTPRALLTQILLPTLEGNFESLQTGKFPTARKFAIVRRELPFWGPFKQMYCGNWDDSDIDRLEFLAQGWVTAATADELAAELAPFLEPLRFRLPFAKATKARTRKGNADLADQKETKKDSELNIISPKLEKLRQSLKSWISGERLSPDVEPRQILAGLIRKSVPWNDSLEVPLEEWRKALGAGSEDEEEEEVSSHTSAYAFVKIEGQTSEPANVSTFIEFERTEETRSLIEALAQFSYAGNHTWEFEHGEFHKRIVASWLRKNRSQIIKQLQPPDRIDTSLPIRSAVQILSTAAILQQHTNLSSDLSELLKSIFVNQWIEEPVALSAEWGALVKDMHLRHKEVLRFLTNELNVAQGRGVGINFVNALPALGSALAFANNPEIVVPDEDYFQGFWKSRYIIFQNKRAYNKFPDALKSERDAISANVAEIAELIRSVGYETDELPDALLEFCADLNELVKSQTDAKMPHPFQPFDELKTKKVFTDRKDVWRTSVKMAQEIANTEEIIPILRFNSHTLKETREAIEIAVKFIEIMQHDVASRQDQFNKDGDPDVLSAKLLDTLEKIELMQ